MTERIHSLPPHSATPTQSVFNAAARISSTKDALPFHESYEEEPYTIKCICDYSDDDGNTIYCETCLTWQHIECFYHGNVEEASRDDFNHFCADCNPRFLDRQNATERQRQQREDRPIQDIGDKKNKRPPSKSHKKKPKPSELQVNGYHNDSEAGRSIKAGSPLESHSKKVKSSHRSHHSISSQAIKRSPPHNHRNHSHGHPISPATTPPDLPEDFRIHSYSKQLQEIYDNDPGAQNLQANSFASLIVPGAMADWLRDPEKLRADAGVEDFRDVFQIVKPDVDLAARWAKLHINSKEIPTGDSILRLRYLSVVEPLHDNALVGELKGVVGFQKDYYNAEMERYTKTCHPAPFVFFHPRLPLYIDTRREGSQCRYIRRSCRSNSTLDTYITNHSEYHFCIVNERPLASGEQVTLPWDFRFKIEIKARYFYLLGLSDEDVVGEPEVSDSEYIELSELINIVLSDYGGCACGLETDCAFARFHRNHLRRLHVASNGARNKKARKPKQHISPTSTGHATNSRDASEGHQESYDGEDDSRSTSGSIQGKPRSRDMSPFGHGFDGSSSNSNDHVSEREKRKLMDIEKTFEKMAQEQPPRKKKRTSDGSLPNSGNGTNTSQKTKQKSIRSSISNPSFVQTNGLVARTYRDAATSRQESDSPVNHQSPAASTTSVFLRPPSSQRQIPIRSNYRDCSTQTDESEDAWYSKSQSPTPKKVYVSLSRRLLNSQHKLRMKREAKPVEQSACIMNGEETYSKGQPSSPELHDISLKRFGHDYANLVETAERPKSGDSSATSFEGTVLSVDTPMTDLPPNLVIASKPPPPPWPASSIPASNPTSPLENRLSDLHVQLPPNLLLSNGICPPPGTPTGSSTPSSVTGSISQSPFSSAFPSAFSPSILNGVVSHPSPVKEKKKLSFQDYRAMRASASKTSTSKDSDSTSSGLKSALSGDDSKMTGILDGSAIVESPVAEKKDDPLSVAGNEV